METTILSDSHNTSGDNVTANNNSDGDCATRKKQPEQHDVLREDQSSSSSAAAAATSSTSPTRPHNPPGNPPKPQQQQQQQHPTRNPQHYPQQSPPPVICVRCNHPGSDVRIRGCPNRCAYHARCIDLVSICNNNRNHVHRGHNGRDDLADDAYDESNNSKVSIQTCPHCNSPAEGLEIVPLSFVEMDRAQRQCRSGRKRGLASLSIGGGGVGDNSNNNNSSININNINSNIINNSNSNNSNHQTQQQHYDPSVPRTGRWTDEELSFRDALIPHFLSGSLPLPNGCKLVDFLSSTLKSKPSRLTKKMKHAKLSTKHFYVTCGHVDDAIQCAELSALEAAFIASIGDPIERTEIQFHMEREWREHFAERCNYLRIGFDAEPWLRSVEMMDHRIAMAKNRSRMVRRRFMMGKVMERDASAALPGIFIDRSHLMEDMEEDCGIVGYGGIDGSNNNVVDGGNGAVSGIGGGYEGGGVPDDFDFDLVASALDPHAGTSSGDVGEHVDFGRLYQSMVDDSGFNAGATGAGPTIGQSHSHPTHNATPTLKGKHQHDSSHSLSVQEQVSPLLTGKTMFPPFKTSSEPNFKFAAPFLAGVTNYMERNSVPFEHLDIWVPSILPYFDSQEPTAPEPSSMGSGVHASATNNCRLCFGGSATLSVHLVDDHRDANEGSSSSITNTTAADNTNAPLSSMKSVPLTEDQIFNYSLFGSYSEKFSFSSGCGLPGRVFQSGIPAWEQFVINAPPHLFERRGGVIQSGIKTALGLPITSPNVGRIVVVLYSKYNREKDEELVDRLVRDIQLLNPCPRWKLVVDAVPMTMTRSDANSAAALNGVVHGGGTGMGAMSLSQPIGVFGLDAQQQQHVLRSPHTRALGIPPTQQSIAVGQTNNNTNNNNLTTKAKKDDTPNTKENKIKALISLLGENMPSDPSSPLGQQLHSIMSLRLVLLRPTRTPQEEQMLEMILVLFESYLAAGRARMDIALFLARDYAFHCQHHQQLQQQQQQQQHQRQQHQRHSNMQQHQSNPNLQQQQQHQQQHQTIQQQALSTPSIGPLFHG